MAKRAIGKIPSLNGTVGCHIISVQHEIAIAIAVVGGAVKENIASQLDETTDVQNMHQLPGTVHT